MDSEKFTHDPQLDPLPEARSQAFEQLINQLKQLTSPEKVRSFSLTVIYEDGLVMTGINAHVLKDAHTMTVNQRTSTNRYIQHQFALIRQQVFPDNKSE